MKTLSVCIKDGDFEGFKEAIGAGAQVTSNHLVAAMRLEQKEIFMYITDNYDIGATNKLDLLLAVFSQIGFLKKFPQSVLMGKLLEYISEIFYGGEKRFAFKKYEYKDAIWFLQIENPTKDATTSTVNQLFLTNQKKVADKLAEFENMRDFVKSYDFVMNPKAKANQAVTVQTSAGKVLDSIQVEAEGSIDKMTPSEIMHHMCNLDYYKGSVMYTKVLENWLQFLKENILTKDVRPYYAFAEKHNIGTEEFFSDLNNDTTIKDVELLKGWYRLMIEIRNYKRK